MSVLDTHTPFEQTKSEKVILPLPPERKEYREIDVYARFMRHLRNVPNSRLEIKVLSALQFTADMTDHSDAHVAKILVECGLRAPRMAFPAEFLEYADQSLMRGGWDVGGPSEALNDLRDHWVRSGDDRFAAFKRAYPTLAEGAVV